MISRSPKRCRHGVVRTKGPIVRVSNSTSLRVMFMAAPHRADWCQNSLTRHPCGKVRNTSSALVPVLGSVVVRLDFDWLLGTGRFIARFRDFHSMIAIHGTDRRFLVVLQRLH